MTAVVAAACVVGGGLGVKTFVGEEPDVRMWAGPGTERGAVGEAAKSERRLEFVPGRTAKETSALAAVSASVEPAPAATAKSAGPDEPAATAAGTTALG